MRLKIVAGNLLAVLLVGLASYGVVRSQIGTSIERRLHDRIGKDGQIFSRSWRLSDMEFLAHVRSQAASKALRTVFHAVGDDSRRQRAFEAAERIAEWFQDPARGRGGVAPDLVAVTDETGAVLARNKDINRMVGKRLDEWLPKMEAVISKGVAATDVRPHPEEENKLLQVAMAPIRSDEGVVVGALVVAYDMSNVLAKREADLLDRHVAFVDAHGVFGSSLPGELANKLRDHLQKEAKAMLASALQRGGQQPWSVDLEGEHFVGVIGRFEQDTTTPAGFLVLANETQEKAMLGSTTTILVLTLLGAIGVLVYGFLIATSFIKPLEAIEEGVLQILNGRTDLRLDVKSQEFGGLADRINQLVNMFTGVEEEDEQGRISRPPIGASPAPVAPPRGPTGAASSASHEPIDDPELAAQLASEPEDTYFSRIYEEYVGAKRALGEDVSQVTRERFVQRLQGNARVLCKKHGCREVRFQVVRDGQVVALRPVLIRD